MLQLELIKKTKLLADSDANVSAVFMYGSFTKAEGDIHSDIEFYFFLSKKEGFNSEQWVSEIHSLSMYFTNEYGSEVAIFDNLIRGEFHFLGVDDLPVITSWDGLVKFSDFDNMILVDKQGLLRETLQKIKYPHPNRCARKNVLWLFNSQINQLLATRNLLKRQEFAHAYQSLAQVQKYSLWLLRLADGNHDHWESPTKQLEQDISPNRYQQFQSITTKLNPEEIEIAFQNSLQLNEILFEELKAEPKHLELLARITEL